MAPLEVTDVSQVETVALWAGLISSVVSGVLSVVAIWFAVRVNEKSDRVSDQTIQSLQKIESAVLRLSEDTSGLIKAAWDKMLGNVGKTSAPAEEAASTTTQLASGVAAELRSELRPRKPDETPSQIATRLEAALARLERTLPAQLEVHRTTNRAVVSRLRNRLSEISPVARELARALSDGRLHLTEQQYRQLAATEELSEALEQLRARGLIVPLSGHSGDKEELVYWFTPNTYKPIRTALLLFRPVSGARDRVVTALRNVGYEGRVRDTSADDE
jgi:hypothetical protein